MNAVLISIRPRQCKAIIDGDKAIEIRRARPKIETPFKCYIYCTKPSKEFQTICGCMVINTDELYRLPSGKIKHDWSGELMCCKEEYTEDNFLNGKVIGEFICDKIEGTQWGVSELKIYDELKMLYQFYKQDNSYNNAFGWAFEEWEKQKRITKAPTGWCYVDGYKEIEVNDEI